MGNLHIIIYKFFYFPLSSPILPLIRSFVYQLKLHSEVFLLHRLAASRLENSSKLLITHSEAKDIIIKLQSRVWIDLNST